MEKFLLVENFLDEGKVNVCGKIIGLSILKMNSYNKKNVSVNQEQKLNSLASLQ